MNTLLKASVTAAIGMTAVCASTAATAGAMNYAPAPAPIQVVEEAFFDGPYLAVGGGIVGLTAKTSNNYDFTVDIREQPITLFSSEALTENLGKYGVDGTVLAGFGRIVKPKIYLGAELFGTYFSPKIDATHRIEISDEASFINNNINIKNEYSFGGDARLGYLVSPRTMLYVLFGLDYSEFKITNAVDLNLDSFPGETSYTTKTHKMGYMPGVGFETVLGDCMTLRGQYTHTFYPSISMQNTETLTQEEDEAELQTRAKIYPQRGVYSLILSYYIN